MDRVETLGPGFMSCQYEDWRPSMDKRRRRRDSEVGYINELPDEILLDILSRLEAKDAVNTRGVSRGWRNLWTSQTSSSSSYSRRYDEHASSGAIVVRYRRRRREANKDSMVLAFDTDKDVLHDYSALNEWIQDSLSHVNLRPPVLDTTGRLQNARLTALYLDSVAMTSQDFERCKKLCPNLETLVVVNAAMDIAIVGGGGEDSEDVLRLKHLEFRCCKNLKDIRLYAAPNLESLKLANKQLSTISIYGSTPSLVRVSLQATAFSMDLLRQLQQTAPRVKQLELNVEDMRLSRAAQLPEFEYVEQLKLIFDLNFSKNLLDLAAFIKACPSLQKLTLMYAWNGDLHHRRKHFDYHSYIHLDDEEDESTAHQHLQVVEFLGWCGHETEVRFANFVISSATHLQDLVFYPFSPRHLDGSGAPTSDQSFREGDSVNKAKACARRLIEKFKMITSSRP